MVQAGPSVLGIVVTLLLVEGGLGTQALDRGLQLHQLCPALLPVPPLLADILGWPGSALSLVSPKGFGPGRCLSSRTNNTPEMYADSHTHRHSRHSHVHTQSR